MRGHRQSLREMSETKIVLSETGMAFEALLSPSSTAEELKDPTMEANSGVNNFPDVHCRNSFRSPSPISPATPTDTEA